MKELRRVMRPGIKRLNWNSLGISDFVTKCEAVSGNILAWFSGAPCIVAYHIPCKRIKLCCSLMQTCPNMDVNPSCMMLSQLWDSLPTEL